MLALGIAVAGLFWIVEAAIHAFAFPHQSLLHHFFPTDSHELWMRLVVCLQFVGFGYYAGWVVRRIEAHKRAQAELAEQLQESLTRALSDYIPICAACKSIREDDDDWVPIESYITDKTKARFSHTVCPACAKELYPHLDLPAH